MGHRTATDAASIDVLVDLFPSANATELDAVLSGLLAWAAEQPPKAGLDQLLIWRDRIEVGRSEILRSQERAGLGDVALDGLLGRQSTSRADRARTKKRAKTLGRNEALASEVAAGRLTGDQLDAIADADHRTEGAAATDSTLISAIASAPVDAARKTVDEFVKAQQSTDDLEQRRRHQRKHRDARRGKTADGLASLTISGDDESLAGMWSAIVDTADAFYRADGDRDLPAAQHPRTAAQRLFDAAHHHLTNPGEARAGQSAQPIVIVSATKLAGLSDEPAELVGAGPIPDSYLEEIACGADFVGMLFDAAGAVLWQGRARRYPTRAQVLALIARDKGCVLCGAHHQHCQAHHRMPWSAPGRGETNIDNLVLLCGPCHRDLHKRNHTIYCDPVEHRWRTRPSTPDETPRPRPGVSQKPKPTGRTKPPPRSGTRHGDASPC